MRKKKEGEGIPSRKISNIWPCKSWHQGPCIQNACAQHSAVFLGCHTLLNLKPRLELWIAIFPISLAGSSNSQIAKTLTTKIGNEIIVDVLESLQQIWKPSSRMRPNMTYKSEKDSTFTCWSLPSTKASWLSSGSSNVFPLSSLGPKYSNKVHKSGSPPPVCVMSPHRSLPLSAYPRTEVSAFALGSSPSLENACSGHCLQASILCSLVKENGAQKPLYRLLLAVFSTAFKIKRVNTNC